MATKKKTVADYQAAYNAAKAKGDTAGMAAAHTAADALRGYSTTTAKDSVGNYYQAVDNTTSPTTTSNTASDYYKNYMNTVTGSSQDALKAAQNAQNLQTQSAITANEATIPQIKANTEDQLRQAYIANMKAKASAPEELSALGYTGGAAESSLLGLDSSYNQSRADLLKSENDALASVYANSASLRSSGQTSLADLASNYYQNLLNAQQNAISQAQTQQNYQTEQDRSNYASTIGAYYQNYAAEKNKILNDNDPTNDWKAEVLEAARQEKIQNQASAAAAAQQQQFENDLATYKAQIAAYKAQKSGSSKSSSGTSQYSAQANKTGISQDTYDMIERWRTHNTSNNFAAIIKKKIKSGAITKQQYIDYVNDNIAK